MIHLDFESRSTVDIWECGAWAYSIHPSTEILCLAYAKDQKDPIIMDRQLIQKQYAKVAYMGFIDSAIATGELFCAYNAFFEQCMYQNILVKKYGWPRSPIKQWRCTAAKARARALPPSLANACQAMKTEHQKSKEGHSVMMKMCKPNSKGGWNEDPEDFEKLYQYCIDDVMAERSLDKMLPDLIPAEQTIWFLDQLINARGISIDTDAVNQALRFIDAYTKQLNDIVFEQSGAHLDRTTRRAAVLSWAQSQGVDITGYTKADVTKTLEGVLPEAVRTVLETKLQLGKTSVAKYQALANSVSKDGRIRDTLIYHGASTGRWTGKLVQLQNLPKGTVRDTETAILALKTLPLEGFELLYPDVMGTLSSCIRGMIVASEGSELIVADYAAIEARVVMWLAAETSGLKQFDDFDRGEGEEPYVTMAKVIYGAGDLPKSGRALGKTAILGCGYGMGAVKFGATCANFGIEVTPGLAQRAVDAYRQTYQRIYSSWFEQERSAIECVKTKKDIVCGKITWSMDGTVLLGRLPSGRCLAYNDASLDYVETPWKENKLALHFMSVDAKTKRWMREHTYGGKIVENITQAVARDILAAAMLRAEQKGYRIIFSVHDEIVAEIPMGTGDFSVGGFEQILCERPQWALDCPIKVKGFQTKRYRKD